MEGLLEKLARAARQARELSARLSSILASAEFREKARNLLEAQPYLESVTFWVSATLVGFTAVWYAEAFQYFGYVTFELLAETPWLLAILTPVCLWLGSRLVDLYAPAARGGGIPAVLAGIELEGRDQDEWLPKLVGFRVAAVIVLSSLLCSLAGGTLGREGPTIQIAASVFWCFGYAFRRVWPGTSSHTWLIAGGAAGMAAAFNTPLGGIVFAIEELAPLHFSRMKTVLISAVIISGMVAQWIWGPYLFFGYPDVEPASASFVPWAILLGVLCGFAGGVFSRALLWGGARVRGLPLPRRTGLIFLVGGGIVAYAYFVSDGVLGGGPEVVRELLFEEGATADWRLLLGRVGGTFLTYLTGIAGGIFAPSLAIGASLGSLLSTWLLPDYANLMVLGGMAAFLSAMTRAPFTALVLVTEMTNRQSAVFHLMVASVVAYAVARTVDGTSFYEHRKEAFLKLLRERPRPSEEAKP